MYTTLKLYYYYYCLQLQPCDNDVMNQYFPCHLKHTDPYRYLCVILFRNRYYTVSFYNGGVNSAYYTYLGISSK